MDRWQNGVSKSPQCRFRSHPSFSSTLLDSIYRTIDDEQSNCSRRKPSSFTKPTVTRSCTSSSSEGSSYGGFSSSDAESIRSGRKQAFTNPKQSQLPDRAKKESRGSIRSRLMRELRKGRDPASPGARFANFINSLFAAKSKVSRKEEESAGSRSCMSKTPSSRGRPASEKRTVRFYPVSVIVGEDCRPCGHKCVYGDERPPAVIGRSAEGMFRRSELEEEEEDGDGESDSSSDLFELENLAVVGRFRDELPVYETTRLPRSLLL